MVAEEFYGWYLERLASDVDPLSAEPDKLATYVSNDLINDIRRQITSGDGLSEDYFLKSQDYLDEWRSAHRASKPVRRGGKSVVTMTLGSHTTQAHRLEVSMVRENETWKIRRVIGPLLKR